MKIKIEERDLKRLEDLKKTIEELQNTYTDDMDSSDDEKLNKLVITVKSLNGIIPPHLNYKLVQLKMVNSDGTKFTIS